MPQKSQPADEKAGIPPAALAKNAKSDIEDCAQKLSAREELLLQQSWGADPWPNETEEFSFGIDRKTFLEMKLESPFEKMIGLQMITLHNNAMRHMHEANNFHNSQEVRAIYREWALKLLAAYARHFDIFAKSRNRGQQQVVVKHMQIAGGQNVIGNVTPTSNPTEITSRPIETTTVQAKRPSQRVARAKKSDSDG